MKADLYERRWASYLAKTHQNVTHTLEEQVDIDGSIKLLDVSAGTGSISKSLSKTSLSLDTVVFNDPDTEMLSGGRKQMIREAFDTRTRFSHHVAEDLRIEDESFDIILSSNAFHRYSDQNKFLMEAYRCLKPEGYLLVQDWNNDSWFRPIFWMINQFESKLCAISLSDLKRRAANTGFAPIICKRWSWRYWLFYTCVFQKSLSNI